MTEHHFVFFIAIILPMRFIWNLTLRTFTASGKSTSEYASEYRLEPSGLFADQITRGRRPLGFVILVLFILFCLQLQWPMTGLRQGLRH